MVLIASSGQRANYLNNSPHPPKKQVIMINISVGFYHVPKPPCVRRRSTYTAYQ